MMLESASQRRRTKRGVVLSHQLQDFPSMCRILVYPQRDSAMELWEASSLISLPFPGFTNASVKTPSLLSDEINPK